MGKSCSFEMTQREKRREYRDTKDSDFIAVSTEEALKDVEPYFTKEEIDEIIRKNSQGGL